MEDQLIAIIEDKILTSLESPLPDLTRREVELPPLRGKAITVIGMRRSGKTSYLHQCRADKINAGANPETLLYFNFEDERLAGMTAEHLHLIPDTHTRILASKSETQHPIITLFLDDIQLISGWEVFVRRMLDTPHYEIFLSGSSAKLLSREIATSMRGRGWEITIYPFSFREYLNHHALTIPNDPSQLSRRQSLLLDNHFSRYLQEGGFPEAQDLSAIHRRQLLLGYVDILLLRDVIERHQVSNVTALRWMLRRLLSAPASLFSITKFAADLKSQAIAVGRETLYDFLDHLEDAFLLTSIPIATDSEKRRQVNPRKVYPADPALIPVYDRSGKANTGHALETAVLIDLQRRGADISYVKSPSGYEVDFLARFPDHSEALIQVSQNIDDSVTRDREVRALLDAQADYPRASLLLLTGESRLPQAETPSQIKTMTVWEWMLKH